MCSLVDLGNRTRVRDACLQLRTAIDATGDHRATAGVSPAAMVRRNGARGGHWINRQHTAMCYRLSTADRSRQCVESATRKTTLRSVQSAMPFWRGCQGRRSAGMKRGSRRRLRGGPRTVRGYAHGQQANRKIQRISFSIGGSKVHRCGSSEPPKYSGPKCEQIAMPARISRSGIPGSRSR